MCMSWWDLFIVDSTPNPYLFKNSAASFSNLCLLNGMMHIIWPIFQIVYWNTRLLTAIILVNSALINAFILFSNATCVINILQTISSHMYFYYTLFTCLFRKWFQMLNKKLLQILLRTDITLVHWEIDFWNPVEWCKAY